MRTTAFASALLAVWAGPALAAGCPSEEEAQASITRSEAGSTTYNARDFEFGPIKYGKVTQRIVNWGKDAQDVCPLRTTVTYKIGSDDNPSVRERGAGVTYLFYQDEFDEWAFKMESN